MDNLGPILEIISNKFDVLFSGVGTEILKLSGIAVVALFAYLKRVTIRKLFTSPETPPEIQQAPPPPPPPPPKKHPLTKPIFKIKCISFGGTLGHSQMARFELSNKGGTAYNVEASSACTEKKFDLGDIGRQRTKNFTVELSPHDHWASLDFQINYIDRDGDQGKQWVWLRYETGRGYVATE